MYFPDIEERNGHRGSNLRLKDFVISKKSLGEDVREQAEAIEVSKKRGDAVITTEQAGDIAYLLGYTTTLPGFIPQNNARLRKRPSTKGLREIIFEKIKPEEKMGEFYALDAIQRELEKLDMQFGIDYTKERFDRCCELVLPYNAVPKRL